MAQQNGLAKRTSLPSLHKSPEMAATHGEFLNKLNTRPTLRGSKQIKALSTCPSSALNICCVPFTSGGNGRSWTSKWLPNSICVHGRLRVQEPTTLEWIEMDGLGAVPIQLPKAATLRPSTLSSRTPCKRTSRLPNRSPWKMLLRSWARSSAATWTAKTKLPSVRSDAEWSYTMNQPMASARKWILERWTRITGIRDPRNYAARRTFAKLGTDDINTNGPWMSSSRWP